MKEQKIKHKNKYRIFTFCLPDDFEAGKTVIQTFDAIDILYKEEYKLLTKKYPKIKISTIEDIISIYEDITGYELLSASYYDWDYTLTFKKVI